MRILRHKNRLKAPISTKICAHQFSLRLDIFINFYDVKTSEGCSRTPCLFSTSNPYILVNFERKFVSKIPLYSAYRVFFKYDANIKCWPSSGDSWKLATLDFVHLNACKTIDIYWGRLPHLESIIYNGFKWKKNSVANLRESPLTFNQKYHCQKSSRLIP